MKRTKLPYEPPDCELCGAAEPTPGAFPRCEGFIVCGVCRKTSRPQLKSMRKRFDAASLGLIIATLAGCGGAPFALIDGVGGDAGIPTADAEANHDTGVVKLPHESGFAPPDASPDAIDVIDAPDAADDGAPEADPIDAPTEACTPIPARTFGCGPPIMVQLPGQYCIDQWGAPGATAPAITAPTPPVCRHCAEGYTCECLMAVLGSGVCRNGAYQGCSIGTTGGLVVVCR
jgi:hypothetical protein